MSKQRFEAEVSTSLKALQGVWMLKVPDVSFFPRGQSPKRIRRPFDFVALYQGQAIALECKQVGISTRFDLGRMRPHQPEALAHFERAGGVSYVLMNFRTPDENRVFALPVEALVHQYFLEASASIPRNWIEENLVEAKRVRLPSNRYGWDLRCLEPFAQADFYRRAGMQKALKML